MVNGSDGSGNSPSSNFFIRFKQNVDGIVHRSWDRLSGTPKPAQESDPSRVPYTHPSSSHTKSESEPRDSVTIPGKAALNKDIEPYNRRISNPPSDAATMAHDRARGEVDRHAAPFEQDVDIESWARHSPYSPFNLQDLPQPVPRDLSQAGYAGFTFRDAFEDLLVVSSGNPLPNNFEVVTSKLREEFMFREGMPLALWVRMLGMHGLWHPYFPQARRAHVHSSPFDFSFDWGFLPFGLNGQDAGVRFRPSPARLLEKDQDRDESNHWEEPETEQDFYERSAPRSNTEPQAQDSPWDALVKAIDNSNNYPFDPQQSGNNGDDTSIPKETERRETKKTWDGGRIDKVWKCRENNGRIETVVTHYRYDADGNLVGQWEKSKLKYESAPGEEDSNRYTSSSRRWSRTWSWGGNHGGSCGSRNQNNNNQAENGQQGDDTKTWDRESSQGKSSDSKRDGESGGWFWTK